MPKGIEELSIQKIRSGIKAIRNKTKTPTEANVGKFFTKLKALNEGMHDHLMDNYKEVMVAYNYANKENY